MRPVSIPTERLKDIFKKQKTATMKQLKSILKTKTAMTVYRKLESLNYFSSCSHSGKYYTLEGIPNFNQDGLWFNKSVLFSRYGTLAETVKNIVDESEYGYSSLELESLLKVKPNEVLVKLINIKQLSRTKLNGKFVYFTVGQTKRLRQELIRKQLYGELSLKQVTPDLLLNEIKASIILFYCTLNEKQRRLYAGLEALKLGEGGDRFISELLNLNIKTVARGRKELLGENFEIDTVRSSGGGRKKKSKK
ncbi:MAG: hypothetical protein KAI79_10770 [Bacteroidales bacterium]|nr:hypothetical protein [Bacteroidales bacterium]